MIRRRPVIPGPRSRLNRRVPIEETVGAIAEMVKGGYARRVGLCEVGAETLRRVAAVHPISDLSCPSR